MNPSSNRLLRDVGIYYSKAVLFALASYLLLFVVYGGVNMPLLGWSIVVVAAFTVAYIPFLVRSFRDARATGKQPGSRG